MKGLAGRDPHRRKRPHATAGRAAGERRAPQRRGRAGEAQRHRRGARRADGLARPRGHTLEEAVTRLRDAVGLEERH